jgi:hypothetical protein
MSWGYWGIVAGLLALLTVFFFCMDLFYRHEKTTTPGERIPDGPEETARVADSKHAA